MHYDNNIAKKYIFIFKPLFSLKQWSHPKGPFPLRAWKRAFFVSFIDLRLKRAVKIEASAKKSIKQTKNALFHARSGNGP